MPRPFPLRRPPAAALAGALLALAVPLLAGPAQPAAAATQSANLLLNGNAETSQCSPGGWEETTVPGWQITSGDPVINCYGVPTGAATSTPGSPTKGTAYFQGGSRGSSEMTQTVDLSSAATAIDAGTAHSTLSGWLGGVGASTDATTVTLTYRDANGNPLGTSAIGPVTAADRGNTTEFLQRASTTGVPAGTRSAVATVDFGLTGSANSSALADDLSLTLDTPVTVPTLAVPPSTVPGFDHVFVVMMENNNFSRGSNTVDGGAGVIGNAAAPYLNNTLVPMGSLLTNYHAGTHNSDPNYEQIAFGNSYGRSLETGNANCITDPACTATNNGLGDNLDAAGKSWKQYTQSQTSNCQTTGSGEYGPDDVPFYYAAKMKNDNAYCQAHWQPLPQLLGTDLQSTATTPAFVWADADSCYDMEDCGVGAGDTWLSQTLPTLFASPAWTQQRSLLLLTFDEDGDAAPGGFGPGQTNQVMTLAIGSQGSVKPGYLDANRYDHYSTARTIEGALGLTATMTNNDKWATPYNEVFTHGPAPTNDFGLTDAPYAGPLDQGATSTATVTTTAATGTPEPVTLTAGGLPAGVTASFNPPVVTAGGTATMTLRATAGATTGEAVITVTGTAPSAVHSVPYTLAVNPAGSGGSLVSGGVYEIVQGTRAMDDPGSSTSTGTQLIAWTLHGGSNQRWTLTQNTDGSFQLRNQVSGLCADDSGGSPDAGSPIIQWTCTGNANQHWSVLPSGGSYALVNGRSALAITASAASDGATLSQQPNTGGALQTWSFTKVG
ncbi:RICIN domain-containing protein [Kitasatospora viridis]|uniref:Ricin-type beta-trefoil lectin protein n=1 Tax=Kitasatospora viridis TaxID=281105 RepID=A0A561SDQ4_9ACTN|nr:RICIN domain-containing protein [Kitasatospora viridis]TWF72987.1 ricin-type beta-trefoil lectin protein [Kitasatospora viridis]